jgi:uncharacterized protein
MATILPDIEKAVKKFINLVSKEKHLLMVFVYGSHAKGLAGKWSDIDLAVVSDDFAEDLFEERKRLMRLALEIDERIEPVPFRPEDFNGTDPLVNEIRKSGVEMGLIMTGSEHA